MSVKLVKSTNGTYYNLDSVRAFFVDNTGPADWFVAVQLVDLSTVTIRDGFVDKASAEDLMAQVVAAAGEPVDPDDF